MPLLDTLSPGMLFELLAIIVRSIAKKHCPELNDQQVNSICHSVRCTLFEVLTNETSQDPSAVFRAIGALLAKNG